MGEPVIICVDDEQVILSGLQAQLGRDFGAEYVIEAAESGEEAMELMHELKADDIDVPVIISDQLMPGMKGHELLIAVQENSPKTFKILLTGQSDITAIADAVNHANLYRYITKPWEGTDLVLTVKEALRSFYQDKQLEEQNELLEKHNKELESLVDERTKELRIEKEKGEELLLNILPIETAKELIEKGEATPHYYEQVTVLFTDFQSFTKSASEISPSELIATLNECFSAFDDIIGRHNLEKIKTIGDAYMCAGGLPTKNMTNAVDAVSAANEMRKWVLSWNEKRIADGLPAWEMRLGAHTGELIAGVVGKKKFAYDVWGDAVNIAARMETNGEVGRVNISADTYNLVKDNFACTHRGKIEAKGKGEIDMYFIDLD